MIHIVIGSTGAGKTTYAMELAEKHGAVRFAIDEWMHTLFFPDLNKEIAFDWAMERIQRCEDMIWLMVERIIRSGSQVVLELSTSTRALRKKQMQRARQIGVEVQLYYLDIDQETRRQRVRDRNKLKDDSFSFEVNDEMFDFVEDMFEPMATDELEGAIVVSA